MHFLLKQGFGNQLMLIISHERWRKGAAERIFHHFIIFVTTEQYANTRVFVRLFVIPIKGFQIKG